MKQPLGVCYTMDQYATCTQQQAYDSGGGTLLVHDYILVELNATQLYPDIVGRGDMGGSGCTHDRPPKDNCNNVKEGLIFGRPRPSGLRGRY
ncbi:hypothetical protein DOTSEDRAFT_71793 [Dothistroma septosporum NZE10]|uniref:Uncharacterized protein n=1 Tax=Dothistroma septosporum (strain NZE10 / CBS 128990) TaxID=675120 RepID=N1PLC1_DOTSN|nr:hypothetical protein DOTSEDRAFT_71793 [Dothistroma septosporum NZE10]